MDSRLDDVVRELRANQRDEEAWRSLYEIAWPYVYSIMFRRTGGDHDQAEEIAQNVLVRMARYADFRKFEDGRGLRAYLAVVARRQAFANKSVGTERLTEDSEAERSRGGEATGWMEFTDSFTKTYSALEEADRKILVQLLEGYSAREIATARGVTPGAAAVLIHRLRKRLKDTPLGRLRGNS